MKKQTFNSHNDGSAGEQITACIFGDSEHDPDLVPAGCDLKTTAFAGKRYAG
jgi:hypothetical protein